MKKLPSKWCIKPAHSDEGVIICDYINQFRTKHKYTSTASTHYYWHYPAYDEVSDNFCWINPKYGYGIITFKQFERWVLKKKNENYNYLIEVLKRHNIV